MEFLNSEPYYASKKIVNQSSDFPVRRTGSYRHKKALIATDLGMSVDDLGCTEEDEENELFVDDDDDNVDDKDFEK